MLLCMTSIKTLTFNSRLSASLKLSHICRCNESEFFLSNFTLFQNFNKTIRSICKHFHKSFLLLSNKHLSLYLADRASEVEVSVATEDGGNRTVVAYQENTIGDFKSFRFDIVKARFVRITLRDKLTAFHLCEVEIYGQGKVSYL
jgi:hypothetical protein